MINLQSVTADLLVPSSQAARKQGRACGWQHAKAQHPIWDIGPHHVLYVEQRSFILPRFSKCSQPLFGGSQDSSVVLSCCIADRAIAHPRRPTDK